VIEKLVFLYVKCGSARKYWRKCCHTYSKVTVTSTEDIYKVINKVKFTGSCLLTEEKAYEIGAKLE
jgi:hypothetical protein